MGAKGACCLNCIKPSLTNSSDAAKCAALLDFFKYRIPCKIFLCIRI